MKRKFLSVFLAAALALTPVPAMAAASGDDCGADGANVTWTLDDDDVLTISGTGAMEDYTGGNPPWGETPTSVVIENGVTSIGSYAFSDCSGLTEVTIPNSVTSIGEYVFWGCSGLTSVTIPDSVTSIGQHAFSGCSSLTDVAIPGSVTVIHGLAFDGCSGLKNVYYGGSKEEWGKISISPISGGTKDVFEKATIHYNSQMPPVTTDYTVSFDLNYTGATGAPAPQPVASGGKATPPTVPTRTDYTFGGWYKEAACTNAWNFDTEVTENITLYAKWTKTGGEKPENKDTYTVTFNSQGGSAVEKQTVEKDGKVKKPGAPTRSGYTFGGWYTDKDCKTEWKFETDTVTGDVTLYAKWTGAGGDNTGGDRDEYEIRVLSGIRYGRVYVSDRYAEPGTQVTITVDPDSDCWLDWVEAVREDGYSLYLRQSGRRYTFTMPESDVTVDASFYLQTVYTVYRPAEPVQTAAAVFVPSFTPVTWRPYTAMQDVPMNSWAYQPAQWAYQNGYLNMAADGTFRPSDPVSHEQMWKIMAQWLNAPSLNDRELVSWARQNGAAKGNAPSSAMTRQDVVSYLYQCYFLMGGDVSAAGNLAAYTDSRLITAEASRKAWTWAVEKGIISGTADGYLNPNSVVSRGEFAVILMRLCQNVMR